MDIIRI